MSIVISILVDRKPIMVNRSTEGYGSRTYSDPMSHHFEGNGVFSSSTDGEADEERRHKTVVFRCPQQERKIRK